MKKAVNLRLEERIIVLLNSLSDELHTTKTEIVEKAIERFSRENRDEKNRLMDFAGTLAKKDADTMAAAILEDKNSKEFLFDL